MIPRAHVTAWRATAPWPDDSQVEQDLVVSRALVDMFSGEDLARAMAFRGGTALHKLFFERRARSARPSTRSVKGSTVGLAGQGTREVKVESPSSIASRPPRSRSTG